MNEHPILRVREPTACVASRLYAAAPYSRVTPMNREQPSIWLVEEDETLADITSFRLELLGYDVRRLRTAEAVLEGVADEVPNLFIVDLFLPGIDGLELIHRLKNDERTQLAPVMTFSTDPDLAVVATAHEAGADDYLVTPYDPLVLQEKIEKLLDMAAAKAKS